MKKNSLTTAVVASIAGVAGFAGLANAVHLNPDGLGQVLLYPYYTVNDGQQTLLSVVNTSAVAKAVKVRFLEGYNTREVLDFNLFLSPYDVWTASIFALSDIGVASAGAAVATADRSCTDPSFAEGGDGVTPGGAPYVEFRDFLFTQPDDGGPYGIDRTREGHFEILGMADLTGTLAANVKHNASGVPANCAGARGLQSQTADMLVPTTGLFGGAGIIDTAEGTYFTYNADALERFTGKIIFTGASNILPNLQDVNDGIGSVLENRATSNVFTNAGVVTSTYLNTRKIDAVSSIFMAESVFNEYQVAASIGANSDWVVTFPTKAFYVDDQFTTAGPLNAGGAINPFVISYDGSRPGTAQYSCVQVGLNIYDREERTTVIQQQFSPPRPGGKNELCREVNVISFIASSATISKSNVLGSTLVSNINPGTFAAGWMKLGLNDAAQPHALLPATNGNVWRGLPVSGFWATDLTNNNATSINGVSTLSNYSGVFRHRASRNCQNGTLACS